MRGHNHTGPEVEDCAGHLVQFDAAGKRPKKPVSHLHPIIEVEPGGAVELAGHMVHGTPDSGSP